LCGTAQTAYGLTKYSRPWSVQQGTAKSLLMMVSIWWAVGMFFLGACAGTLAFALMSMTAREAEEGVKEERAVEPDGLSRVQLDDEWTDVVGSPSKRVGGIKAGEKRPLEVEPA